MLNFRGSPTCFLVIGFIFINSEKEFWNPQLNHPSDIITCRNVIVLLPHPLVEQMTFYLRLEGHVLFRISRYKGKDKQPDWNYCELGANIPSCCWHHCPLQTRKRNISKYPPLYKQGWWEYKQSEDHSWNILLWFWWLPYLQWSISWRTLLYKYKRYKIEWMVSYWNCTDKEEWKGKWNSWFFFVDVNI